ncbi:iron-dependent peroxidase [Apiospora saccharicola]|uniref:Iron-dependent peroxidase n=1 Tax=Apiospora saccharicola TaxID=335842 RepID=A0ABR1TIN9_9PEZI
MPAPGRVHRFLGIAAGSSSLPWFSSVPYRAVRIQQRGRSLSSSPQTTPEFHKRLLSTAAGKLCQQQTGMASYRVPIAPQSVDAPLTQHATFLVLAAKSPTDPSTQQIIRSALAGMSSRAKNVAMRDLDARFSCTVGIGSGSNLWDHLFSSCSLALSKTNKPEELRPFRPIHGNTHAAPATRGDLLFHIRAERRDLCFEFERQLLDSLGKGDDRVVEVVDETVGFRYFDARDLLGFVDGTANPVGAALPESVLVMESDSNAVSAAVGGSYVVVQKYVHDMPRWNALSTEQQEAVIGRTKLTNEELDDVTAAAQPKAHKTLTTIVDEQTGEEHDILRDNMPFGSPGTGQFGTYFIGYSRRLWVVEKMLERMFVGVPAGMHDRILDYSTALTGTTFFAPSASFLASLDSSN